LRSDEKTGFQGKMERANGGKLRKPAGASIAEVGHTKSQGNRAIKQRYSPMKTRSMQADLPDGIKTLYG
jgi:hypothetical protein